MTICGQIDSHWSLGIIILGFKFKQLKNYPKPFFLGIIIYIHGFSAHLWKIISFIKSLSSYFQLHVHHFHLDIPMKVTTMHPISPFRSLRIIFLLYCSYLSNHLIQSILTFKYLWSVHFLLFVMLPPSSSCFILSHLD